MVRGVNWGRLGQETLSEIRMLLSSRYGRSLLI